MELDKYYVGVVYPGSEKMERREVAAIDFKKEKFILASLDGTETVSASIVTPLDARGRPRTRFTFNLDKGLNVYQQSLPAAFKSVNRIIETYETRTGDIPTPTYRKAKAVKEELISQVSDVLAEFPEQITVKPEALPSQPSAPIVSNPTIKREARGVLAMVRLALRALLRR